MGELGLPADKQKIGLFLLYKQQYLEMVAKGQFLEAVNLLQTDLRRLNDDVDSFHGLASLLLC